MFPRLQRILCGISGCSTAAGNRLPVPACLAQAVDEMVAVGGINVRVADLPLPIRMQRQKSGQPGERRARLIQSAQLPIAGGEGAIQHVEWSHAEPRTGKFRGLLIVSQVILRQRQEVRELRQSVERR